MFFWKYLKLINYHQQYLNYQEIIILKYILISDILTTFDKRESILSWVITYGACCIDDLLKINLIILNKHFETLSFLSNL